MKGVATKSQKMFLCLYIGMGYCVMGLDGISSQVYQNYQQTGGRPALLPLVDTGKQLAHKNAAEQWAGTAANLTAQQALAHRLDRTTSSKSGQAIAEPIGRSYSQVLNLGTEQIKADQVSWNQVKQTAARNFSSFGQDIRAGNFSPKTYFNETLVQRNVQPVKNLFNGVSTGQGWVNAAGGALVGYDVLKNTRDTYKDAKAREDGSLSGELNTAKETATAFGKYTLRDGASWEAAGIGGAIGKALIPVNFKGVPVGGVLFGALGAVSAQKGMNHVLNTGDNDPVQQRKALAKAEKKAEKRAEKEARAAGEKNHPSDSGA